jgi:hypothetical protein
VFICPDCGEGKLRIVGSLSLPSDSRSDEISVQAIACDCGFRGGAVYEESRRGSLDSDCWEHEGYRLTEPSLLHHWVESCPDHDNTDCPCLGHAYYRDYNDAGRWRGLGGTDMFLMRHAR